MTAARLPGPREDVVQAAILQWLRLVLPDADVTHVPNGGLRGKREAAKLKWLGVVPGVPDLVVILPEGRTVWLEVKRTGTYPTPEQRALHARWRGLGHTVAVVRSVEDARAALDAAGVSHREVRAA